MPESKNNKPKTEKTSASVTSTLPRLCPTNNFYLKDTSCNIPKLKNRFQGNREILDEKQKHKGGKENSQTNFQKLNSDKISSTENASILQKSIRNYHSQIPVRYRHSLNTLGMPPTATRSPSPPKKVSPKGKFSNKVKIITLDQDTKQKRNAENSRSSSPIKTATCNNIKAKQQMSTPTAPGNFTNSERMAETKRTDTKRTMSTKLNSKVRKSKDKTGKELQALHKEQRNSIILKQASQPSLSVIDKIQPQEKISLDQLKSEVYEGDRARLSFEKVHLCFEKSMDNLSLKEKKRSYFVKYSSENARNQKESSLTFLQNISSTSFTTYSTESEKKKSVMDSTSAIKTISGHELILTPSMKLDIEKGDVGSEDLKISEILQETIENLQSQKEIVIPQDDSNEYDSEVSTDGELVVKGVSLFSTTMLSEENSEQDRTDDLWKSREAEMLSDVDYRQSVYHPAVSRRHKNENEEFLVKSKSSEDNFNDQHSFEDATLSLTKTNSSLSNQMLSNNNDKPWVPSFDKTNKKLLYNPVVPAESFYGIKKVRTKKERVSGALLHFTLKMIRLLAIFNLWPGDNCHMLTSQSLRLAS